MYSAQTPLSRKGRAEWSEATEAATFHKRRHLMTDFGRHLRIQTALCQGLRVLEIDMAQQIFHARH